MQARDARFDGQFITGVHSTGIYCRPSCPAVAPKPSNVSFYLTAAAAHEAGLRACKRCLPDAVPGSRRRSCSGGRDVDRVTTSLSQPAGGRCLHVDGTNRVHEPS
ncbi:Ada metal-binding domain-containing protein, partial [Agromyces humi]|uniref:Ada metal-binding domain-containing protein n=1 Tax=Agromyces humi TaxID=1766800 RepID=UPI002E256DFB